MTIDTTQLLGALDIVGYVLAAYFLVMALYVLFIASMNIMAKWDTLSLKAKVAVAPIIVVAVALDWVLNMTLASVVFWDLPAHKKELITGRLKRYHHAPLYAGTWRYRWAAKICDELLDPFDLLTGNHC